MHIDKSKLKCGIWFEDAEGNVIPHNSEDPIDYIPENAITYHVSFPLAIQEEITILKDCNGVPITNKSASPSMTWNYHIGAGSSDIILAMANSGDYTLPEALSIYAHSCERCMNVLAYKYLNKTEGYAEHSEEWEKCNTVCEYCKEESNGISMSKAS